MKQAQNSLGRSIWLNNHSIRFAGVEKHVKISNCPKLCWAYQEDASKTISSAYIKILTGLSAMRHNKKVSHTIR